MRGNYQRVRVYILFIALKHLDKVLSKLSKRKLHKLNEMELTTKAWERVSVILAVKRERERGWYE